MDVHGPEEDFESIPWGSVTGQNRRPAWQPAVAGIVVGAALVFVLFRPGSESTLSDPVAALPSTAATTSVVTTITTVHTPPSSVLAEADLLAVDSVDLEAAAGSVARRFLTDFFSVDERGRSAAEQWIDLPPGGVSPAGTDVAVDAVDVLDARRVAPDRVIVMAEVRRSRRSEPGTVDRTRLEVEVVFGDEGAEIADLPRPAASPVLEVPPNVVAAGAAVIEPLVAGELLSSELDGGVWHLVFAARDRFGMVWPLAVTVDAGAVPDVPVDQEK